MAVLSRRNAFPAIVLGVLAVAAVLFVVATLGRRSVSTFAPTEPRPAEAGPVKVGPLRVTVDAQMGDRWRYFDFSRGSLVEDPEPLGWDLAFRRFQIASNGGDGMAGSGGILDLGEVDFDSVATVPTTGYLGSRTRSDSTNTAIARWYRYSWHSHLLDPKARVYAVKTADGRFAKMEIVGYYCPGVRAGCPTFRYLYQGMGGTDVSTGPVDPSS